MISTERSKNWRKKVMVLLILINLGLLFSFIWQAFQASRDHLRATQSVLQDYASMAAQQFAQKLKSNIGYWAFHDLRTQLIQSQLSPALSVDNYFSKPESEFKTQQLLVREGIQSIYLYNNKTHKYEKLFANDHSTIQLDLFTRSNFNKIESFKVIHPSSSLKTIVLLSRSESEFYAVEFSKEMIYKSLEFTFQSSDLLPQVLANKLVNNDEIALKMKLGKHPVAFQKGQYFDRYLSSKIEVNDDYGNLFEGYTITVSLDETIAHKLIIGGVPSTQFFKVLLLILVTFLVLIITLFTYRKEQKLSAQRSQFVARVSHELRTPLTQIRMFSETMLLDRVKDKETTRKYLEIIHRESKHLSYLVDNILNKHENENNIGTINPEWIDVAKELRFVVDNFNYVSKKRGVIFAEEIAQDIRLKTDQLKFRQIFLNLIDNAIKYGPDSQTISITTKLDQEYFKISIRDQGPGIDSKEQKNIWRSYYRLDRDEKRAINGTGIGLAITAENLKEINAFCKMKSSNNAGACFEIYFPSDSVKEGLPND